MKGIVSLRRSINFKEYSVKSMEELMDECETSPSNNLKENVKLTIKPPIGRQFGNKPATNFTKVSRTGRPIRKDLKEMPDRLKHLLPAGITIESILASTSKFL